MTPLNKHDLQQQLTNIPLPGQSAMSRFNELFRLGRLDLSLAKLIEPHYDAMAIWHDLAPQTAVSPGVWAVWAAEHPRFSLTAEQRANEWFLAGDKAFCSGAKLVDHALITVPAEHNSGSEGPQLFAIDVAAALADGQLQVSDRTWNAAGMKKSATVSIRLDHVRATAVGNPGQYLDRPGFWHGAIGVSACWAGGLAGLADLVTGRFRGQNQPSVLSLRALGEIEAEVFAARAAIEAGAARIDHGQADRQLAEAVRWTVVAACDRATAVAVRLLGAGPLVFDAQIRQQIDDLQIFTAQHHGDKDLMALGELVTAGRSVVAAELAEQVSS